MPVNLKFNQGWQRVNFGKSQTTPKPTVIHTCHALYSTRPWSQNRIVIPLIGSGRIQQIIPL